MGQHGAVAMGFADDKALDALRRFDGDVEKATNYLLDNS